MLETFLVAFTTFFATVDPPGVAIFFAGLSVRHTAEERRVIGRNAALIGGTILFVFAVIGDPLLRVFGISLPALRTAGGILLLLIAIDMIFARASGGTTATSEEKAEAESRTDVTVFPLATPLIAGPGAIGSAVLLVSSAERNPAHIALIFAALLAVMVLTYILLMAAARLQKLLGVTGAHVFGRVFGIMLAALAVQFLFDGIRASGLLSHAT